MTSNLKRILAYTFLLWNRMTVSGIHLSLGLLLLLLVDEGRETGKPERPADPHRGLEVDLVSPLVDAYFGDDGHPQQEGPACSSPPSSLSSASFTHPHSSRFLTGRTRLLPPASWPRAGSIPPFREWSRRLPSPRWWLQGSPRPLLGLGMQSFGGGNLSKRVEGSWANSSSLVCPTLNWCKAGERQAMIQEWRLRFMSGFLASITNIFPSQLLLMCGKHPFNSTAQFIASNDN